MDYVGMNGQLVIDSKYYNRLDIEGFSLMMKDPSYCYKFYWLEAIVKLITEDKTEASYDEIINEMICNAWFSVLEYHIHLSGIYGEGDVKDNLEKAVVKLQELSQLPNNATHIEIKNSIKNFDSELHSFKMNLTTNVPIKALSGFANKTGDRISLDSSASKMMAYYNRLSETDILLPYTYGTENGLRRKLTFSKEWIAMIQDNAVSILGWIQFEKVKWLQSNNPEIPGLVYKIAPDEEKKRKLGKVHELWDAVMTKAQINDVFKNTPIDVNAYDVDHFIPFSFVMNDELWNLMPMDSSLNSTKNNKLPKWEPFFERFAKNQYVMYGMIHDGHMPDIRRRFEACYRDNLHSIWANRELYRAGNSVDEFYGILEKNMRPVYDSAKRQGYQVWNLDRIS